VGELISRPFVNLRIDNKKGGGWVHGLHYIYNIRVHAFCIQGRELTILMLVLCVDQRIMYRKIRSTDMYDCLLLVFEINFDMFFLTVYYKGVKRVFK